MGLLTTLRTAPRSGVLTGADLAGTGATTTVDGPISTIVTPSTASEFEASDGFIPDYFFPCQEASGNVATTIGSLTLSANGAGTHLYQQTVTGWTRKAVGSNLDGDVCAWRNTAAAAGVLDPTAGSVVWSVVVSLPTNPGATRVFLTLAGTAPNFLVQLNTTGNIVLRVNAVNFASTKTYTGIGPFPMVCVYNKTAGVADVYTHRERIVGTYVSTVSNSNKGLGQTGGVDSPIYRYLSVAGYQGRNAERDWKAFIAQRGWQLEY